MATAWTDRVLESMDNPSSGTEFNGYVFDEMIYSRREAAVVAVYTDSSATTHDILQIGGYDLTGTPTNSVFRIRIIENVNKFDAIYTAMPNYPQPVADPMYFRDTPPNINGARAALLSGGVTNVSWVTDQYGSRWQLTMAEADVISYDISGAYSRIVTSARAYAMAGGRVLYDKAASGLGAYYFVAGYNPHYADSYLKSAFYLNLGNPVIPPQPATFTKLADCTVGHMGGSAECLADGNVIVVSGFTNSTMTSTAATKPTTRFYTTQGVTYYAERYRYGVFSSGTDLSNLASYGDVMGGYTVSCLTNWDQTMMAVSFGCKEFTNNQEPNFVGTSNAWDVQLYVDPNTLAIRNRASHTASYIAPYGQTTRHVVNGVNVYAKYDRRERYGTSYAYRLTTVNTIGNLPNWKYVTLNPPSASGFDRGYGHRAVTANIGGRNCAVFLNFVQQDGSTTQDMIIMNGPVLAEPAHKYFDLVDAAGDVFLSNVRFELQNYIAQEGTLIDSDALSSMESATLVVKNNRTTNYSFFIPVNSMVENPTGSAATLNTSGLVWVTPGAEVTIYPWENVEITS